VSTSEGAGVAGPAVRNGGLAPNILHIFVFLGTVIICQLHKLNLSE